MLMDSSYIVKRRFRWRAVFFLIGLVGALTACGGGGGSDSGSGTGPDWLVTVDTAASGAALNPALLGHYDLSGVLYQYDQVSGLPGAMQAVGFAEWRVGVGRWT